MEKREGVGRGERLHDRELDVIRSAPPGLKVGEALLKVGEYALEFRVAALVRSFAVSWHVASPRSSSCDASGITSGEVVTSRLVLSGTPEKGEEVS
ncbi:MAG TPA: hypothetical protein VGQ76_02890 [Thermoanaerobaculia bacterium]|jgi:hypothetical protein|nr:hypothetical protein [Thermoanaerobaculia bacterium]